LHGFILDLLQDKVKKSNEMERISIAVIRKGFGKQPSFLQIFNAILHSLFSAAA